MALRVAVAGPGGNVGYAFLWHLVRGACFGDRRLDLRLLEVPAVLARMHGMVWELEDSAPSQLDAVVATADPAEALADADQVVLIGAIPHTAFTDRVEMVRANAPIYAAHGRAIAAHASPDVRVTVVGRPRLNNCRVAAAEAPSLPRQAFTAMVRLEQHRAIAQIAARAGVPWRDVEGVRVWGHPGVALYVDCTAATVGGDPASDVLGLEWVEGELQDRVARRGDEVVEAHHAASPAATASALADHLADLYAGRGDEVAAAVHSAGAYGIPDDLVCALPAVAGPDGVEVLRDVDPHVPRDEVLARAVDALRAEVTHVDERRR